MQGNAKPQSEITALLVAPDRRVAQDFLATVPQVRAFQILAELKSYPGQATLEMRLRQLKPNVLLVDVSFDLQAALEVIKTAVTMQTPVHVVALNSQSDSQAILQSLRAGAVEFLAAPFDVATQKEAVARL